MRMEHATLLRLAHVDQDINPRIPTVLSTGALPSNLEQFT